MSVQEFTQELIDAAGSPHFFDYLLLIKTDGTLKLYLPEIDIEESYFHDVRFHPEGALFDECGSVLKYGSVWQHTLAAIKDYGGADPIINLGLLFHDIGKPAAAIHKRSPHFHNFPGHENLGVPIMQRVGKRLGLSRTLIERLTFLIANHMMICRFPEMRKSKIVELITHPDWKVLREVTLHDDRSRARAFDPTLWQRYDAIVCEMKRELAKPKPFSVSGTLVMELTGLAPGPELGAIVRKATALALENPQLQACPTEAIREALHLLSAAN